jgi:hypothetical protein
MAGAAPPPRFSFEWRMTAAWANPMVRATIRVASIWPGQALFKQPRRALAREIQERTIEMKRFVMLTVLLASIAGAFAALSPASADPHGDRMKRDCASGARKC